MSSTISVKSTTSNQSLANQIASQVDANKDGQISTSEFGSFILNMLEGKLSGGSGAATLSSALSNSSSGATVAGPSTPFDLYAPSVLGYNPTFLGFDSSRGGSANTFASAAGSLKYDAYNVLKNYDPRDPNAMKQAFAQLNSMHPGAYELDNQDNLMLTGTADGYIGARPVNRDSDWNNRAQDWGWQWFSYNAAHPGPSGQTE